MHNEESEGLSFAGRARILCDEYAWLEDPWILC